MLSPARAISAPFVPELLSDYFFVDDRNNSGTPEEDQYSDDDSFYLSGDESEVKQQSSSFVSSPELYGAQIQPETSQNFKHAGRRNSSSSGVNYVSRFPLQNQFPTQFNSNQFRTNTSRNTRPQSQPNSPLLPLLRPRQVRAHSLAPATRDGVLQMSNYPNRPYSGNDGEHDYVGPFLLGPELGRGCSGTVRLGTHRETGFEAAFKIIDKKCLNGDVKLWKKLKREIAILKLIEHPHILKLYDVLETESRLYLVLEHVKGGELFDYIVSKGRLNRDESLRITAQIIQGLEYCHAHSIAHRDLKPENLLLDEEHNVKIADFGMAQLMRSDSILRTSCGSPHYASPEIIEGHDYDAKVSDVWSIGVILYALITGSLPFDHDNIPTLLQMVTRGQYTTPAYVPSDISDLISKMLTVDPVRRIRLHQIKKHSCYAGTHYFDIQRTQSWPYLSNLVGVDDSDASDSELADEPSTVYRQSSMSTSSRSGLGIYSRRGSLVHDCGADSDDDTRNVDEGVLKDLESLGLGRDSTREELKQKVTGKSADGEPTVERKFYTLLKQRRNSRLEQLSVLSPKITRRLSSRRVSISDVSSENDGIPRFDLSSSLPSAMLSSSMPVSPPQPFQSQHARSATYNDPRYIHSNDLRVPSVNPNHMNQVNNSHNSSRATSHSDPQSNTDPLSLASAVSLPFIDSFKGFLSVNS